MFLLFLIHKHNIGIGVLDWKDEKFRQRVLPANNGYGVDTIYICRI
jgi:hypothetical protein